MPFPAPAFRRGRPAMFRTPKEQIWFFDCEWVPDPQAGRLLHGLPPEMPDAEVLAAMWARHGATPETPRPFLKTVLCRVVSIAAVLRRRRGDAVRLDLLWLPRNPGDAGQCAETAVVGTFLQAVGRCRPQLVGFNSRHADLKILLQRAVVGGVSAPEFCRRPDKPWEGVDYFARDNDYHVDLMDILGSWQAGSSPALHEIATLSGIPGKFAADGEAVALMWLEGRWRQIVQYNCFDALTTYLLWLRMAHLAGHVDADGYEEEQLLLNDRLLELAEKPETEFLNRYIEEWERLRAATATAAAATPREP